MDAGTIQRIRRDPKFLELERRRSSFGWSLCVLMLAIYYGFILLIAFAPKWLATPLTADGVITIGFPLGLAVIISAIVLTGLYVWRANAVFDRMTREIVEGAR
jgi:uncharacterized membrane protein (DUF485 family)